MRIFVLSRGYPTKERLYSYPFVRDRAEAYQRMGHQVMVYVPTLSQEITDVYLEGVSVITGPYGDCQDRMTSFAPDCVAAHAITDEYWPVLKRLPPTVPVLGWIHGSEMESMERFQITREKRSKAAETHKHRQIFWRRLAENWPRNLHLVFVSQISRFSAFRSLGTSLPEHSSSVIHNPIDTDFFCEQKKTVEQRFNILCIRPFDNFARGTDLVFKTLMELSSHSQWSQFQVTIFGDGPLFDDHTSALKRFENVSCFQRFLTRHEILRLHRENGVFLIPSRHDSQGISRDEAMSSGLVPITNAVAAIPEFTDQSCASLAQENDVGALAAAISELADNPAVFQSKSSAAMARVREQSAMHKILSQELSLMEQLIHDT